MNPATITLTHANLKVEVQVAVALLAAWYWSPNNLCTHVVTTGGATFPATERPEIVSALRLTALAGAAAASAAEPSHEGDK